MKRGNTALASSYTGPLGELVVDTGLQTLRIQDGSTPGGWVVTGGGGSGYGNTQVAAYLAAHPQTGTYSNVNVAAYVSGNISTLFSNAAAQASSITTLFSNAAAQATAITALQNQASSYATLLNPHFTRDITVAGNVIAGNLHVLGNTIITNTTDIAVSNSVINLHTPPDLSPWTYDDGTNIGIKIHYYKTQDSTAFLGMSNDTGYLEWFDQGTDAGNIFAGTNYGTIKTGNVILDYGTLSSTNNLTLAAGSGSWTFNSDGTVTMPLAGVVKADTDSYTGIATHDGNSFVYVNADGVYVNTLYNTEEYEWHFGNDGSLKFPNGAGFVLGERGQLKTNDGTTVSLDFRDQSGRGFYTNGDGYTLRSNGTYNWLFKTDGSTTFPNGTLTPGVNNGFNLLATSDAGADTEIDINPAYIDIYAWNGGENSGAELYLNNADVNNPYAYIYTQAHGGTGHQWTFDKSGNLTIPGNINYANGQSILSGISSGSGNPDGGVADNSAGITVTTYTLASDLGSYDNSGSVTYNIASAGATDAGIIIKGITANHTQIITGDFNQGDNTVSWGQGGIDYQLWEQMASVTAYVVDSRGYTFYTEVTDAWDIPHGPCLVEGTMITMADGTHKAIEDIAHGELVRVWNFDLGEFSEAQPLWIKVAEETTGHDVYTFSDGTKLRTVGHHVFNKQAGAFTKLKHAETPVGTTTFNEQGLEVTLVSKERVIEPTRYYNVWTQYHMNLFADGILTSNRFNNIYPIVDMKFVKDDRALRSVEDFAGIDSKYVAGLRLQEQTYSVDYISNYVHNRLERLDVANSVEQGI